MPEQGMTSFAMTAGTSHVDAEFANICDAVSATQRIKHKTRLLLKKKHAPQLVSANSFWVSLQEHADSTLMPPCSCNLQLSVAAHHAWPRAAHQSSLFLTFAYAVKCDTLSAWPSASSDLSALQDSLQLSCILQDRAIYACSPVVDHWLTS